MAKKVLIIGGVAGGASTAARLRRVDEEAEIIMFEKGEYISFANCGLPYYIGGTIQDRDALLVQTPEAMMDRFNMDVRVQHEVLSIDREAKKLTVRNIVKDVTYEEAYDTLVLSPGSVPLVPPIPGIDLDNIYSLWNMKDTDEIFNFLSSHKVQKAVVVGGGFIGIEMAENLHHRGIQVSLVELADQVMQPLDGDMAESIHRHMRDQGIDLHLDNGVQSFKQRGEATVVKLQDGTTIDADLVILSIGIRPRSELAKDAGLALNKRGGIVVDEYLKTSDLSIYAVGDAIEVTEFNLKGKTMVPLAGPANKQGRICANNIAGLEEKYVGTQGTSIVKVWDLTVASTGLNEKQLNALGKTYREDYYVSFTHSKSHAGYYPGAIPMTIKLIFGMDGKVLGAQIIGYDGVDKRIDVIATAIRYSGSIYDLKELELAYAPPFSSAKDPVNMAGFVAENIITGRGDNILYREVEHLNEDFVWLDVREPEERELGFIPDSINIPVNELRKQMHRLPKDKLIIPYCAIGLRGYIATRILNQNGFEKVRNLSGGYGTYSSIYCQEEADACGGALCQPESDFSESGDAESKMLAEGNIIKLNACGLQCPGPIMQVFKRIETMENGDVLEVEATDPGFVKDIKAWCLRTGHRLLDSGKGDLSFHARIQKGGMSVPKNVTSNNDKTMVVFSGELDKAIASLIIANGAASMGRKVTMFYTFWGLNILRKPEKVKVKKNFLSKMFAGMMPRGMGKLKLSNMNFLGMGPKLIRHTMKVNNVDQLEVLMQQAMDAGVEMMACTMSMELMGITKEELMDGVTYGGVATYLGAAEEADVNLFI